MITKSMITSAQRKVYEADAKVISFWRCNPVIACRDLLGIELLDYQKWVLQSMWVASYIVLVVTRNGGKSFIVDVFLILWNLLFENQRSYIISSVGDQAKETFTKIEEIVLRQGKTADSIKSLKTIAANDLVCTAANRSGFSHPPSGYTVTFHTGSTISTLNSQPDNARSRRANIVFYDEAAFCSAALIAATEPFATQSSDFMTDTSDDYNPELIPRRPPNKLIYASSQDGMDTVFYRYYKDFSKKMIAGDRDYFVCDLSCEVAINTYMNGEPYTPLLSQDKVDTAMSQDKEKALREYYNRPTRDGGVNQIIKWGTIRSNEKFFLPQLFHRPGYKATIAFDPARSGDNSIVGVMYTYNDKEYGVCGDIINCVNFVDGARNGKYKLDSNRQLSGLRKLLLDYNGTGNDYENIDVLMIDAGSGGGGVSTYADQLLNDWVDSKGIKHRGLIDSTNDYYRDYLDIYPSAIDKLRLISPKKYRTQMVEEFIELMNIGVIRFPYEYNGNDTIMVPDGIDKISGEEKFRTYSLSAEEQIALMQIDLMKKEITSIDRSGNADNTSVTYALSKSLERKMNDDRFYVSIMLAHRLYELRRGDTVASHAPDEWGDDDDMGYYVGGCVSVLKL